MLALDLIQTLALAGVVLFVGYGIKRRVPLLSRYNIPAPVVGGLLVAAILSVAHQRGLTPVTFDATLQTPLQNAFFASVGFGASLALLRIGGPLVLIFFVASTPGRRRAERARPRHRDAAGAAAAARRPGRVGDAHRRTCDRAGVCAAVRGGRRAVGGDAGRRLRDGRHRLRRAHRRSDRHVAHREAPAADTARPGARRRRPGGAEHRRGAGRRAGAGRAAGRGPRVVPAAEDADGAAGGRLDWRAW